MPQAQNPNPEDPVPEGEQDEDAGPDQDAEEAEQQRPRRNAARGGRGRRGGRGGRGGRGRENRRQLEEPDNESDDEANQDDGNDDPAPLGPRPADADGNGANLFYSLSSTIVHTLEELWSAILKTHIIAPSGPRKADNDIYTASEAYITLRMGPKESLSSFKERFNFALRRVAIIGGAAEAPGIAATRFIKTLAGLLTFGRTLTPASP